jgi:hypothetical protein
MAVSSRPSGGIPVTASRPTPIERSATGYDVLKVRVLLKLHERLDLAKARRMPHALFLQTARQQVEQVVEVEAARLSPSDKARLGEDAYREAYGLGPLEELFPDAAVKEVLVLGPTVVVVRRDAGWTPTNVKFRDAEHVMEVLERAGMLGEVVSPGLPTSATDLRLPNGFRMVAVVPPDALNRPATVIFVREHAGSQPQIELPPVAVASPVPGASSRHQIPPAIGGPTASPAPGEGQFARYRTRITERIVTKMAGLGVYDLSRVDVSELRRVIIAYIDEFCLTEKVFLSGTDQGRMMLEILAGMKR